MSQRSLSGASPVEYTDPRFSNEPVFHATTASPMSFPGSPTGSRVIQSPEHRPFHDGVKVVATPRNIFLGIGVVLIILLCVLPVWNAASLLQDPTYIFWHSTVVPVSLIVVCAVVLVLYIVTIWGFFTFSMPQAQTEQTIMMTANVFLTLLGLAFMLVSIPLSKQAADTYSNLISKCDYSPQTHRLYEYSQVLQNIRQTPDCAEKYSVEECAGYENAPPYTAYLKVMENDLMCSGFCYMSGIPGQYPSANKREAATLVNATGSVGTTEEAASNATGAAAKAARREADNSFLLRQRSPRERRNSGGAAALAVLAAAASKSSDAADGHVALVQRRASLASSTVSIQYPPALFSTKNYQASCEGMAARHMKNFAGGVASQTFYQGIYLVLIAVVTGFLKLFGFCVRRDQLINKPPQYYN